MAARIDASGHVKALGFIATHFHWPRPMGNNLAVLDGRTTLFDLEMGTLGTMVNEWYAERAGANQFNYGCASHMSSHGRWCSTVSPAWIRPRR